MCARDVHEVPLPGRPQVEREHGPVRLGDQCRLQPQLRARLRRGSSLQILQILILQSWYQLTDTANTYISIILLIFRGLIARYCKY